MRYQKLAIGLAVAVFSLSAQAGSTRDWGERALNIQNNLDVDAPLKDATWPGTHNSFANADDDNFSGDILNQSMSLKKQLDAGIRQMVMDVHYDGDAPRVCHNNFITVGWAECVDGITGNRKLQNALGDIVEWINDGNSDQVVLIKLEMASSAKNNINKVRKKVDNYDSYYYRPDSVSGLESGDNNGCKILPLELSKADVLAKGKNIILFGDKCYGNSGFSGRVFSQGDNLDTDGLKEASDVASSESTKNRITRVKDGATKGGVFTDLSGGSSVKMKPSNVMDFLSAGLNIVETYGFGAEGSAWKVDGEYPIAPQDLVWSWAEGWPSTSAASNSAAMLSTAAYQNHLYHRGDGNARVAACRNASGAWIITSATYTFANASSGCSSESGGSHVFAMPRNKLEMDRLITYRDAYVSRDDVYVNYHISGGKWVADIGQ